MSNYYFTEEHGMFRESLRAFLEKEAAPNIDKYTRVQYNNVMPQYSFLTDDELANVLTYIRSNFGNSASEIKPEEIEALRKLKEDQTI